IKLVGSHAGVSIGWDGPSQMGLEDIAMMRAVGGSTVLYPCDANQTTQLVVQMADRPGVVFLRTTREKTPVLYAPEQRFPIGGGRGRAGAAGAPSRRKSDAGFWHAGGAARRGRHQRETHRTRGSRVSRRAQPHGCGQTLKAPLSCPSHRPCLDQADPVALGISQ